MSPFRPFSPNLQISSKFKSPASFFFLVVHKLPLNKIIVILKIELNLPEKKEKEVMKFEFHLNLALEIHVTILDGYAFLQTFSRIVNSFIKNRFKNVQLENQIIKLRANPSH